MREEQITLDELRARVTGKMTGEDKAGQLAKLIAQVKSHPEMPEMERAATLERLQNISDLLAKMTGNFSDAAVQKEPVKKDKKTKSLETGTFGLFSNKDGVHCFNIRDGDSGLPLESILPENMRGTGYAQAPIRDYITQLYIWLASNEKWQQALDKAKPALDATRGTGKKVNFLPPVLDVHDLKLLDSKDEIDYQRLRDLCLLVAPYWDKPPQIGLIVEMIKRDIDIPEMATILKNMAEGINEGQSAKEILAALNERPEVKFYRLFLPPELRLELPEHKETDAAIAYAMKWIRSTAPSNPITKTKLAIQTDMRQLGVMNAKGKLDENRARLISDYIWSHRDAKPSFLKLLEWLRDEVDGHKVAQEKQVRKAQKGQVSKARLKAKKARKKAKKNKRK
ncbi:MAG: hypothetical protein COA84_10945 [Robiginitomaculum sp.]|nr:MAG: hypothetical protein COA84_10945 [Robiginitomaculum sp.]